jgi:hypothetical protein
MRGERLSKRWSSDKKQFEFHSDKNNKKKRFVA